MKKAAVLSVLLLLFQINLIHAQEKGATSSKAETSVVQFHGKELFKIASISIIEAEERASEVVKRIGELAIHRFSIPTPCQ